MMRERRGWGVWCIPVSADVALAPLWYEVVAGVPWDLTEADARELAGKVNREGRYRATARPLETPLTSIPDHAKKGTP